jgi:hypothetical protein
LLALPDSAEDDGDAGDQSLVQDPACYEPPEWVRHSAGGDWEAEEGEEVVLGPQICALRRGEAFHWDLVHEARDGEPGLEDLGAGGIASQFGFGLSRFDESRVLLRAPTLVTPEPVTATFRLIVSYDGNPSFSSWINVKVVKVGQRGFLPAVDAGQDFQVVEGRTARLLGDRMNTHTSFPVEGWHWRQLAGPSVLMEGSGTSRPSFQAPAVGDKPVELVFSGTMTIGNFTPVPSLVSVRVVPISMNHAPLAIAGPDMTVARGSTVTLRNMGSDPDNDPLREDWVQVGGQPVTLSRQDFSPDVQFTAPQAAATITFRLTVSDGIEESWDEVTIIVR